MRRGHPLAGVLVASTGLWALTACTAPATPPNATASPAMAASTPATPLTVPELLAQAGALKGHTVTLAGSYAGWSGGCQGGPPVSRSDWMVEDKATRACIYVHGPQPAGIPAPPQPASIGLPVRLSGEVELTPDGRPYLRVPGAS